MGSILKKTLCSLVFLASFYLAQPASGEAPVHILAFGDSLTAGYGLNLSESFAARLEQRLQDQGRSVRVTNAGISGDTSAGGLERLPWSLQGKPHLVILELGANDGLRGLDPEQMEANLRAMIELCLQAEARVILAGMHAPVNWGKDYQKQFNAVFPALSKEYKLPLYPFFLDGVLGKRALVLPDGMHPNARGVDRMVTGILPLIETELDALDN